MHHAAHLGHAGFRAVQRVIDGQEVLGGQLVRPLDDQALAAAGVEHHARARCRRRTRASWAAGRDAASADHGAHRHAIQRHADAGSPGTDRIGRPGVAIDRAAAADRRSAPGGSDRDSGRALGAVETIGCARARTPRRRPWPRRPRSGQCRLSQETTATGHAVNLSASPPRRKGARGSVSRAPSSERMLGLVTSRRNPRPSPCSD